MFLTMLEIVNGYKWFFKNKTGFYNNVTKFKNTTTGVSV